MKRRSRVNLNDPPILRKFSSRGITGVRRSHNRFDNTTSIENEVHRADPFHFVSRNTEGDDMNMVKRVKFQDPGTDKVPKFRPDASSIQNEATLSPRSDHPKTSEYAFFKKVKKNASGHSYPLQKNDNQLKDGELAECTKEIFNEAKQSYKDLIPSLPIKKSKPINHKSFISTPAGVSQNSPVTNMVDPSSKGIRSPLLVENFTSASDYFLSSPFSGGSKNSGNQYFDKGVFSTRRRRLRQWVSTSLPELDESCSEGVDLVNLLLSRLFPEDNESNYCLDPNSRQVQIDTKHQLPSCSASDRYIKGLNWTCTRNLIESGRGSYLDDGFSGYGSDRPRDIVIPELDTLSSDYPSTFYTTKTRFKYKYSTPLNYNLCPESDPFCGLPHPKYGSTACHLKELDEFNEPNRPALRGEPHTLMLGWDFKNEKEREPPIISHNTEMKLFSVLATSWSNCYPQNVHDRLNASIPCSLSLFSNYSLHSLLDSNSAGFNNHHFGRYLLDEKYQISHNPKYLKLVEEDFTGDCTPEGNSIVLSPQDHTWFMNQVYGEPLHPSGLDFGLGSKCLSMVDCLAEHHSSHHHAFEFPHNESHLYNSDRADEVSEGTLIPNDWPIINFQTSRDEEMGPISCPLLLDNSSWIRSEEEIYCDDDVDDEWKYI